MQVVGDVRLAVDGSATYAAPRLVALGADFRQAGVSIRERLAIGGERLPSAFAVLRGVAREGLILSTCNRTEIVAVVEAPCSEVAAGVLRSFLAEATGLPVADVRQTTSVRYGQEAARHLFRVAGGLESLVLGEPQILGQIRDALAASREADAIGPILSRLTTDALRVGKKARTVTGIARNRCSIPHAAIDLAGNVLDGFADRSAIVIGAGEIGDLTARLLRAAGVRDLVIANRTLAHGQNLASAVDARAIPLASLPSALTGADVVFGAAGIAAGNYLVDAATLDQGIPRTARLVLVDLGLPRTFDPALADRAGVRLFDVDDLQEATAGRRSEYAREIARTEELVEAATHDFLAWWRARAAAPTIAALRERAEAIRQDELERALSRLGHLSPRDREVVAALSAGLVGKLLHDPTTRLQESGEQALLLAAARALFGIEETEGTAGAETLETRRQSA